MGTDVIYLIHAVIKHKVTEKPNGGISEDASDIWKDENYMP